MDHLLTFADSEYCSKRRQSRNEIFLMRMESLIPGIVGGYPVCLIARCRLYGFITLQPVADHHSYRFRPYRSTADAVGTGIHSGSLMLPLRSIPITGTSSRGVDAGS